MELLYQLTLVLIFIMTVLWITQRKTVQKTYGISPIMQMLIMIAVGILFLYIPYYWITFAQARTSGSFSDACVDGLKAVFMGILEIPRHFALALEFAPVTVTVGGEETQRYFMSQVLLWVLAPLGTASFLFMLIRSLFQGTMLKFNHKRPVYYFSSLNEKSFTLANSLYEQSRNLPKKEQPFLVFCQVDVGDENNTELQFSADAERLGAIFEKDPVHAIKLKDPLRQQVKIFLMDEDEDNNILSLLRMEESVCPVLPGNNCAGIATIPSSDIYIFSTHESSELLFDQTLENFNKIVKDSKIAHEENPAVPVYHYRFNLHLIDETKLIVQNLLLEHPLFEPLFYVPEHDGYTQRDPNADRDDHISVLAIGGGMLGMELVRSAMVCGITDNYNFDVQVIDQNAKTLEKQFRYFSSYKHCFDDPSPAEEDTLKVDAPIQLPDIFNGEDGLGTSIKPVFHEADCRSTDFDEVLEKYCQHSNYIVVATGDDELNISTARHLQRWYARLDIIHRRIPSRPPMIFAAIRNSERYEALKRLEEESAVGKAKQLFLFGNNEDIFSAKCILSRPLDISASLFHHCYQDYDTDIVHIDSLCTPPHARQEMRFQLAAQSQVNQFSNQMVALHSNYKLQDLLFKAGRSKELLKYRQDPHRNQFTTETLFHSMATLVRDSIILPSYKETIDYRGPLTRLEHRRWNLFQLLDGWETFPIQMVKACNDEKYTEGHKLKLIKLHGCIIPFDELATLEKTLNRTPGTFVCYDACMCVASLFAWLDLEADPTHAECIREKLTAAAKEKWPADATICTFKNLLDLIAETFDPARIAASAK